MRWQIQQAKAKFSQVVQKAHEEAPQIVTRHGKKVAVVVSAQDYRKLQAKGPSLLEVLMSGPEGEFELPQRTAQEREIAW